jgi:hypothetical protein
MTYNNIQTKTIAIPKMSSRFALALSLSRMANQAIVPPIHVKNNGNNHHAAEVFLVVDGVATGILFTGFENVSGSVFGFI